MNDVTITPTDNGPYLVHGSVTLLDAEGNRQRRCKRGASEVLSNRVG